jgi:hypothetical protein
MDRREKQLSEDQQDDKEQNHHKRPEGRLATLPSDNQPLMEKETIGNPG